MSSPWGWDIGSPYSDQVARQAVPSDSQSSVGQTVPITSNPAVIGAVAGFAFLLSVLRGPLLQGPVKPDLLEDDSRCGITTGGQEECYFDCKIVKSDINSSLLVVEDLTCLLDCIPNESDPGYCITSLLLDVIEKGTCNETGVVQVSRTCKFAANGTITKGTCSDKTEELWKDGTVCLVPYLEQPVLVYYIASILYATSCRPIPQTVTNMTQTRLPPIALSIGNFKTTLQYTNTRHRYPWICSLRTRGVNSEHLCTVTLLAVPPRPTVMVSVAHCTYLCKDRDRHGVTLPSCCCGRGQESCSEDRGRCGTQPRTVEMDGEHADIVCGEWETGPTTMKSSKEEYNIILPIKRIIRHERYDAEVAGPGAGNDIAVFHVDDTDLAKRHRALRIHPACLPPKGRARPEEAVHAGWSKPPPYSMLFTHAPGFTPHYKDFFKLWHYSMKVLRKCQDPKTVSTTNLEIKHPSNTYYPQGTICAEEMARLSCFSTAESGSPLMVREKTRPQRFYIEGLLSFLKGCNKLHLENEDAENEADEDVSLLSNSSDNPSVYTKLSCFLSWVAEKYGMKYVGETEDEDCRVGNGEKVAKQPCRQTPEGPNFTEFECIFPFYYQGKFYKECFLLTEEGFTYPSYLCPVRNITTKKNGYNDFGFATFDHGLKLTKEGELDPSRPCDACGCTGTSNDCFLPFFSCKNDCPGVKSYGIIGGGALLVTGTALGSLGFLGGPALLPVAGLGGAAMLGMTARMMCTVPYCRARSGQCCLLAGIGGGPRCPRSC